MVAVRRLICFVLRVFAFVAEDRGRGDEALVTVISKDAPAAVRVPSLCVCAARALELRFGDDDVRSWVVKGRAVFEENLHVRYRLPFRKI